MTRSTDICGKRALSWPLAVVLLGSAMAGPAEASSTMGAGRAVAAQAVTDAYEATPKLRCVPWAEAEPEALATVPFVTEDKTTLPSAVASRKPTLSVYDNHRVRPLASAWLLQLAAGLYVAIDVHDDTHVVAEPYELFDAGDAVEVQWRLGLSDFGAPLLVPHAEALDARDATLTLATSSVGAKARLQVGSGAHVQMLSRDVSIVRDERLRLTRYRALVPWTALHTAPGASEAMGVGVVVRSRPNLHAPQRVYRAYVSAAGGHRPSAFLPLRLASPPGPFAVVTPVLTRQGSQSETLVARVRGRGADASLQSSAGFWQESCPLGDGVFDVAVSIRPGAHALTATDPVYSLKASMADERVLDDARLSPQPIWQTMHAARARLQALEDALHGAGVPSPVSERGLRHAQAVRVLLERQRSLASLGSAHEQQAQWGEVQRLAAAIAAVPMSADHDPWDTDLREGQRASLELALNPTDSTLAPGALFKPTRPVPKGETRPLVVFLHGRGSPSEAQFVETFVNVSEDALPDAYVLVPWARGNAGAQREGEEDVLALIEAACRRYAIDRDAVSLVGFSLGGSGAFSLALHAPQTFSAVAIASGGAWNVPLGRGLGENVRGIPFFLWHGGFDSVVPVAEQARILSELKPYHVLYEAHIETLAGHVLSPALKARMIEFVVGKRRHRPSRFRYVTDGPYHRGRDGIAVALDTNGTPSFAVERDAAGWHVTADDTRGLEWLPDPALRPRDGLTLDVQLPQTGLGHAPFAPRAVGRGAPRP